MFSKHVAKTEGAASSLTLATNTNTPPPLPQPRLLPHYTQNSYGFWGKPGTSKGRGAGRERTARTEALGTFVLSMNCE